jgi:speckle-type POZ protein
MLRKKYVVLKLIFFGEAVGGIVKVNLSCRLVDPKGALQPSAEKISATTSFRRPSDSSESLRLMSRYDVYESGFVQVDVSLTVECAVQVFRDLKAIPVPSSNLPQHLGELLESHAGADVTFSMSGKSFAAHKIILAARSPVFMAEFFGGVQEKTSERVEIQEMEPSVFAATLVQHLLVAADRYGLDRLKMMCERRLAFAIDTTTCCICIL